MGGEGWGAKERFLGALHSSLVNKLLSLSLSRANAARWRRDKNTWDGITAVVPESSCSEMSSLIGV